jgi:hypothetical protein
MKLPVLIVGCLIVGVGLADAVKHEMWAWKDANGVTHYSDRPVPGARRIEIATMTPESVPQTTPAPITPGANSAAKPSTVEYTLLEIWSPEQDETFYGADAQVDVRVRVEPELASNHHLRVYLDGKLLDGSEPNSTERSFGNLERGAHSLLAQILDDQGNELIRSEPRVFHVRQPTLNDTRNVGPSLRPKPTPQPTGKPATAPKAVAGT